MDRKLRTAGLGLLAVAAAGCTQKQETRPNIILILADDIGAECIGCYGGAGYSTPNLDALATRAIRYENMHSTPLSTPSRVQLMTGVYNDRNYVNFGYMNDDEHTFAHLARQAGYSTAVVGKWQLGRSREMVGKLGFDEWCLTQLQIYKELAGARATDRYAFSYVDDNGHYEFSYYAPDDFQRYAFDYIDRQTLPALLSHPAGTHAARRHTRFGVLDRRSGHPLQERSPAFPGHGRLSRQAGRTTGGQTRGARHLGQHDPDLRR